MPDLYWIADLGAASVDALWLPVLAWTAVALAAEAALRLGRTRAALALPVRGAVLAALPLAVALPAVLRWLAPEAAVAVAAAVPDVLWLPEVAVGGPAPVVEVAGPAGPPLLDVLLGLAVLGVAVLALVHVLRLGAALVGVARAQRTLPAAGPDARAAVDAACGRMGVARPVRAAVAPAGVAPFTVGVRRPLVALPADLDGEARELAALHEAAHVRRADAGWHAAQRAVAAVFAAHPLVWALGRGLDLDRERAADAAVLALRPAQRRAYADLLFSYAALPAPPLALGAARGSSSLKTRIDAMTSPLSPTQSRRFSHLGRLIGLLALVAVVGVAAATAPAPAPGAASPLAVLTDSTHIERVDITRGDDGAEIDVRLKPGSSRADAEAVAAEFDGVAGEGTVEAALRVYYPGGVLERTVRVADGQLGGQAPAVGSPAEGLGLSGSDAIDRVDVRRGPDGATVEIVLKPGTSRAEAERIADDARRPDAAVRVLMTDGTVVERPAVRTGARRDTTEVYEVVEEMPQLIGGLDDLMARVEYPAAQARAGVEGRAVVQFVVDESGRVVDPTVIRSSGNDGLDQAALAAVRGSAFEPGRQRGEAVRVRFAVPITFRLGEGAPSDGGLDGDAEAGDLGRAAPDVFEVVEQPPVLIGGLDGLMARVEYPPSAREAGTEGRVVVQFVVDEEGRVVAPVVIRSSESDVLDEAALAAVRGSRFEPGVQRGQPVKVRFAVPITFRLPAEEE